MRVFIAVLILIFSLQTWTKADDISDFEIEGMSIGDSLLDYFSEEEIIKAIRKNQYEGMDGKFIDIDFYNDTSPFLKIYEGLQIVYKKNDINYKIYSLAGSLFFKNDINKCLEMQKIVDKDLSNLFKKAKRQEKKQKYSWDETGKSYLYFISYYLDTGDEIEITCYELAEHLKRQHYLLVAVDSKEFKDWLRK